MQQAGQVPYLDQNDAHEQSLGQSDGSLPGLEQTLNQSINQTIALAGLVICNLSPTMSCQWASVSSGLWCSSDLVPILCPLSRAVSPGQLSRTTFAGAPFAVHKLWAMS